MSIGQGSVGEFSVSELPLTGGTEVAVGGIGVVHLTASIPDIVTGAIVDVPAKAIALVANAPALLTGVLIEATTGTMSLVGNAPQALQSVNLLVSNVAIVQLSANAPDLGTGVFIDNPSRQDSYTSTGGSIGNQSIAEFALGEGAPETTLSGRRTARLRLIPGGEPVFLNGKLILVPVGTVSLIARVPETLARGRKLRTQAILS